MDHLGDGNALQLQLDGDSVPVATEVGIHARSRCTIYPVHLCRILHLRLLLMFYTNPSKEVGHAGRTVNFQGGLETCFLIRYLFSLSNPS